jgi:hypothetical protein
VDLSTLLVNEPDFRDFCDGILLMEVGPLVQLYRGAGRDGGVDAEFNGSFGGIAGRWVFQFKFTAASRDASQVRSELLRKLKAEFKRPRVTGADGYVLMTMVPATVEWADKLHKAWSDAGNSGKLCVWDLGHLAQLASRHGFPGVSVSERAREVALSVIVLPTYNYLVAEAGILDDAEPAWPVGIGTQEVRDAEPVSFTGAASATSDWRFAHVVSQLPGGAASHPLAAVCWSVFYPSAGAALTKTVKCRQDLEAVTTDELTAIAGKVRTLAAVHAPHLSAYELDRMAMGIAHGAACTAWSMQQRIGLLGDRLELRSVLAPNGMPGSAPVATGSWVAGFAEELRTLVNGLRRAGVPTGVRQARDAYSRARADFLAEAWYPLNLGVDRPRITGS